MFSFERELLTGALQASRGRLTVAADLLEVNRDFLSRRVRMLNLRHLISAYQDAAEETA